jgi:exodeoxyribonuclease VII small subunit
VARRPAEDPAAAPAPAEDAPPFEEALARLEQIVARLERGDLPLEQALAAFEAGVALTRRCARELEDAERRIEVLVREGEQWLVRPFEAAEDTE